VTEDIIIVYGTPWCFDCYRAKRFLDKNNVPYEWVNIDKDKEAEKNIININNGSRSVPTIVFQDGSILVEPSNNELKNKIGTGT
jgi:mycoredoxin